MEIAVNKSEIEFRTAHVPLSPLHGVYVRFFIHTIKTLKPIIGTKNIFLHSNGQTISRVEILGFVTVRAEKEHIKFELNDGTGNIYCIEDKKVSNVWDTIGALIERNIQVLSSGKESAFHQALARLQNSTKGFGIKLGDIVIVQGRLTSSRWNNGIQVIVNKIRCLEERGRSNVLGEWLQWTQETTFLNLKIYSKTFSPSFESIRNVFRRTMIDKICEKLSDKLIIALEKFVLNKESPHPEFYGCDALEFSFISNVFETFFQEHSEGYDSLNLTSSEIRLVKCTSLSRTLHSFVVCGKLMNQKPDNSIMFISNEKLDAIYHVTSSCRDFVNIVITSLHVGDDEIRKNICNSNYHFIVDSRHYRAVINYVLSTEFDSTFSTTSLSLPEN